MKMIRAFIRPEKEQEIVLALEGAGFPSLTKMPVFGLPKTLVMMVVEDSEVDKVINLIQDKARTGFIGDGKIFVSPVEASYTVRTGEAVL